MKLMLDGKNKTFVVVIPVLNQHETTERLMETWFSRAKSQVSVLFIDNASDEPLADQKFLKRWQREHDICVLRNEHNIGVYPTLQQGFEHTTDSRFIFYAHNDVEMLEYGWDEKLTCILKHLLSRKSPGVCGMFGAIGLGTKDIYQAPYDYRQLMRWGCYSVNSMAGAGAEKIKNVYKRVLVLDGFSLIVNRYMVHSHFGGKFDYLRYPVHHMYDQDVCLDSHYSGYENYVVDIDCIHHGGVTSTNEKWAEKMGTTDLKIHRQAHVVMYEKFRNRLPAYISS